MSTALVGYTGFVGTNLSEAYSFDYLINSKNIGLSYGTNPDLLVYAGVRAEMFIANSNPEVDFNQILVAIENIKKINPKNVVLISTVAVYDKSYDVDEDYEIDETKLTPYGRNRLFLEKWVLENYKESLVVRLPAIYGLNLKKNFLYDYIHVIPRMLTQSKYDELASKNDVIKKYYKKSDDGYFHCTAEKLDSQKELKTTFEKIGFSALNFTDSRSVYQFYNLKHLWNHIQTALNQKINLLNIVTEPLSVAEAYESFCGNQFYNCLPKTPFNYGIRSKYSSVFGGRDGYLMDKNQVKQDLKDFVDKERKRLWG